jgi:predicted acyltransferase
MDQKRLLSLDAFRGFTIAAMILVNDPGSWSHIYPPLEHAAWNGLTPTDLIFPFFLFIVGVSIALSYTKALQKGVSKKTLYRKILFRTFKIFMVGLLLNYIQHFKFSELRYAGVLQRIAIVFLFGSILFLNMKQRALLWTGGLILVLYWLAMVLVPTPGYSKAMLEPGVNLAAWIDSLLLPGKLWQGTWDPEGILSTFPALVTCIMGIFTGQLILSKEKDDRKVIRMFTLGTAVAITGYFWGLFFPVNKNIWTSSYVLVTGGFAMILLAASIFRVDMLQKVKIARFGIIFGSNAIAIYVLADLLTFVFYGLPIAGVGINEHFMSLADITFISPEFLSMIYALLYVGILFIPAWWLYKRKIFIKL